jgi:hypothetical protein
MPWIEWSNVDASMCSWSLYQLCSTSLCRRIQRQTQKLCKYFIIKYYTCQLCGMKTPLDISSVIELEKLVPKRV